MSLYKELLAINQYKTSMVYRFRTITNLLKSSTFGDDLPAQTICKASSIQVISNSKNVRSSPGFYDRSTPCPYTSWYNPKLNMFLSFSFKNIIMGLALAITVFSAVVRPSNCKRWLEQHNYSILFEMPNLSN